MRNSPGEEKLAPTERILDCEIRQWAEDLCFRWHMGNSYPEAVAQKATIDLSTKLVGAHSPQLWIMAHDSLSFCGHDFQDMDLVISLFLDVSTKSFWTVM